MMITINGTALEYSVVGSGKHNLLLLHGWGTDYNSFEPILDALSSHFKIWMFNFPGCGNSPDPSEALTLQDYGKLVNGFMKNQKIQNPVVLGHSHGGRVAAYMAAQKDCKFKRLILVDSSGIPSKHKSTSPIKTYAFKAVKGLAKVPVFSWLLSDFLEEYRLKYGSDDYKVASPVMRKTLVNLIQQDITLLLPNIKLPTLILWGANDKDTPLAHGQLMAEQIPNAELVVLENAGHYAFLDQPQAFLQTIRHFLAKEMGA